MRRRDSSQNSRSLLSQTSMASRWQRQLVGVTHALAVLSQHWYPSYWALQPFCWASAYFSAFLILCTVGRTPWTGDQPVASPLPTQNKRTRTSMPPVGLEPTISVLERARILHGFRQPGHCDRRHCYPPDVSCSLRYITIN
jgi:hypothetical protein